MKQPIELRKIRDFGQTINDSFTFFKENFKPLFKALIIICGFFIIIGTVSSVFTYLGMSNVFSLNVNSYESESRSLNYFVSAFINAFVIILTQVFVHLVTLCYISVYLQNKNTTPTLAEVWGFFKYYFFRVIGSGIVAGIIMCIGFVFCLIPGIYLSIVYSLLIPIIVMENASFSYAFNKCFRLIKDNWWLVFGVTFIMSLIVGITGMIAEIPLTIFTVGGKLFSTKVYTLPIIIIFSILKNVLTLAYVLPAIAISMCYFSLSEQKEGTGLLDRIAQIGKSDDDKPELPAEEY